MQPRECCVCKRERAEAVVTFPLLREGYPMGAECHASWRREAQALGRDLNNPARRHLAFKRWLEGRVTPRGSWVGAPPS